MSNKRKATLSAVGLVLSFALLIVSSVLIENKVIDSASAVALTTIATILLLVSIFYAAKIEHETHHYECKKCGHIFKPTFKEYLCGSHTLTKRRLKCPKCEEKSWCKVMRDE